MLIRRRLWNILYTGGGGTDPDPGPGPDIPDPPGPGENYRLIVQTNMPGTGEVWINDDDSLTYLPLAKGEGATIHAKLLEEEDYQFDYWKFEDQYLYNLDESVIKKYDDKDEVYTAYFSSLYYYPSQRCSYGVHATSVPEGEFANYTGDLIDESHSLWGYSGSQAQAEQGKNGFGVSNGSGNNTPSFSFWCTPDYMKYLIREAENGGTAAMNEVVNIRGANSSNSIYVTLLYKEGTSDDYVLPRKWFKWQTDSNGNLNLYEMIKYAKDNIDWYKDFKLGLLGATTSLGTFGTEAYKSWNIAFYVHFD